MGLGQFFLMGIVFFLVTLGIVSFSQNVFAELAPEPEEESKPKIPEWVKNTMQWYLDGQVTEDEMINALQFLIQRGILKVEAISKPITSPEPKETPKLVETTKPKLTREIDVEQLYADAKFESLSSRGYEGIGDKIKNIHDEFLEWFESDEENLKQRLAAENIPSDDWNKIIDAIELFSLARITNGDVSNLEDAKTIVDDYLKKNILPLTDLSHLEKLFPEREIIPSAYMIQDSVDFPQGESYRIPLNTPPQKITGFKNVLSQTYKKGDWQDHIFVNIYEFESSNSAESFYDDFITTLKSNDELDMKKPSEYTSNCFVTGERNSLGGMASVYCQYSNIYFDILSSSIWSGGIENAEITLDSRFANNIMESLMDVHS